MSNWDSLRNGWDNLRDRAVGLAQRAQDRFGGGGTTEEPADERWASASQLSEWEQPRLIWFGGFVAVVLVVVAVAVVANPMGWLHVGLSTPALATEQQTTPPVSGGRTSCAEFLAGGNLNSPQEGVWFQGHCLSRIPLAEGYVAPSCRRTSADIPEFTQLGPDLYVFQQGQGSAAFLWHASAPGCFDLVSSQVVTAVCADGAVSFDWDARSACSSHGGVMAWVNGP